MLVTDNLATRITAILLAGFVVVSILVAVLFYGPLLGREGSGPFELPLPQEAGAMVEALEGAPVASRPAIVRALNTSVVAAEIRPDFPPSRGLQRNVGLERLYRHYAPALAGRAFEVHGRRFGPLRRFAGRREETVVRLAVALETGQVLVLERRPSEAARAFLARGALVLAAVGATLLAALAFAVRQTARPVAKLSQAVQSFARDLDAPDLPQAGPREIRELSAAFNDMKARIRALVGERTRVLAAVAHDMRTYLTRLRLRADFIDDPVQRAKAVADLEEMAALLDDTLMFARDQGGRPTPAERLDLAAEAAAFVALRAEMGQPVSLGATPADPLPLAISRLALRRILANLVDNALRYGGAARLAVGAGDGEAWLSVEDDGPGVPEADLARITEPFERLDPSRARATGGAGLGLAIVRGLAEAQGGRLSLTNRRQGGLQAVVAFPAKG